MKTSTVNKVRLPIDDVVNEVLWMIHEFPSRTLDILAVQTPYVVAGVLREHRESRAS